MDWRASTELSPQIKALPGRDQLRRLFELRFLVEGALVAPGYVPSEAWATAIRLSSAGEGYLASHAKETVAGPAEKALAVFSIFSYDDILLDWQRSDPDAVLRLVEAETLEGKLRFPNIHGRALYDAFNELPVSNTDHLEADLAWKLLEDSPAAVFQVGRSILGPMGILQSQQDRFFPPGLRLPLWHCSDTGCHAPHHIFLERHRVGFELLRQDSLTKAARNWGPPSEWDDALWNELLMDGAPQRVVQYRDLGNLVADSILDGERTLLVETLLRSDAAPLLRSALSRALADRPPPKNPADLAAFLTPSMQLQLILVCPNETILRALDRAVYDLKIRVPPSEVRHAHLRCPLMTPSDPTTKISASGCRSVLHPGAVEFVSTVLDAYSKLSLSGELGWRLKKPAAPSLRHAVFECLRERGAEEAVRGLILSSGVVTQAIAAELDCELYPEEEDSSLCSRLLWKLGFNLPRFEDTYKRLFARLKDFRQTALSHGRIRTEDDREAIRKAGVNFFISIEEVLERLVAYNVWLLSSDHFAKTRFRYETSQAIAGVPSVLGASLSDGQEAFAWDPSGRNTFAPLLRYLSAARDWMRALPQVDSTALLREKDEFPFYADHPGKRFAFRHTQLWADCDPAALARYTQDFARVVDQVHMANIPMVRNGLDHKRKPEEFPSSDQLLATASRIGEALEIAQAARCLPVTYWLTKRTSDAGGSQEFEFANYAGEKVLAFGPCDVSGLPEERFGTQCLLAPGDFLGATNSTIIFECFERSTYHDYWLGYPRRRRIPRQPSKEPESGSPAPPSGIPVGQAEES